MLIEKKEYKEEDGSVGYIESIYDSSNILKSTYFLKENRMYISFKRGNTYSYENVPYEVYEEFEKSESHGKYFHSKIRNNPNYLYKKEFKLYPDEIKIINETIKSKLDENEER